MRAPNVPRRRFGDPPLAPAKRQFVKSEEEEDEVGEEFDEDEHRDLLGIQRRP